MQAGFEYGDILYVTKGKWVGHVGIYDDDSESASGRDQVILILGPIGISSIIEVPTAYVKKANRAQTEDFAREYATAFDRHVRLQELH